MPHNTMQRVTVRMPDSMVDRADALVEAGEYPNRSEVFREGVRDVFSKYDFSRDSPRRRHINTENQPQVITVERDGTRADAREAAESRVYGLRSIAKDEPFIVFDAGGLLEPDMLPEDVVVARNASQLREAIGRMDA